MWCAVVIAVLTLPLAVAGSLYDTLQAIVDTDAHYWNVSLAAGISVGDTVVGVVAGVDDHATGALADADTQYPSGSVAKVALPKGQSFNVTCGSAA